MISSIHEATILALTQPISLYMRNQHSVNPKDSNRVMPKSLVKNTIIMQYQKNKNK